MRDLTRVLLRCLLFAGLAASGAVLAQPITLHGAVQFNDDHAFNRALVKFQELTVKYYGKPINFVLHKNSELGLEKDYFALHEPGHLGRLRHRVAGAHVDVLEGRAVHRRAVPVPRPRPLEQGARRRHAEADRRRGLGQGRRDADRLRRRRHAQHLRQQAGAQPGGDEGAQGPRAGRADLEQDLRRGRHVADRDRLRRDLQRDPERRDPGRRERGRRRRGDEVLRSRPEPQHDAARDHDPADLLLRQDVQEAAAGPAGRDPQGRQGSGDLTAARSSRATTQKSSKRWKRPASSSGSRSPTARR